MIKPKKLNLNIYTKLKKYKQIYYLGNPRLLIRPSITVVGSRKCTSYGLRVCTDLCTFLGERNYTTVSGYVAGIDMQVYKTALAQGFSTIVCLGYGFKYLPKALTDSLRGSPDNLLILSQFDPDQSAKRWTFPSRDALLASVGAITVVVEAGMPSGTFYTVKQAFKEKKLVYSIPGSIYSSQSLGTNFLIEEGLKGEKAHVLYDFKKILQTLGASSTEKGVTIEKTQKSFTEKSSLDSLTKEEVKVLNLIDAHPQHFDDILKSSKFESSVLLALLSKLEILGLIKQESSSMYRSI